MKAAFFEVDSQSRQEVENALASQHELLFFEEELSDENVAQVQDIELLGVFIYSKLTAQILEKLPKLRFITTMSTGFDHIDMEECKKRSIVVANVPTYGEITVAEHAFALMLALSRRLLESYDRVKSGYFSPEGLIGFDLAGKTLGVVGLGEIGQHVVQIAHGFGMNVIGFKRTPDPELEAKLGIKIADFDTVLSQSDIVTLHVPYTPQTHHMLNDEKFTLMKKNALVINTARGAIIDTKALLKALEEKRIAGAGLDVCEGEPLLHEEKQLLSKQFNQEELMYVVEEQMLLHLPNVIITPHNAFNSREALTRIITTSIENVKAFANNTPQNIVS